MTLTLWTDPAKQVDAAEKLQYIIVALSILGLLVSLLPSKARQYREAAEQLAVLQNLDIANEFPDALAKVKSQLDKKETADFRQLFQASGLTLDDEFRVIAGGVVCPTIPGPAASLREMVTFFQDKNILIYPAIWNKRSQVTKISKLLRGEPRGTTIDELALTVRPSELTSMSTVHCFAAEWPPNSMNVLVTTTSEVRHGPVTMWPHRSQELTVGIDPLSATGDIAAQWVKRKHPESHIALFEKKGDTEVFLGKVRPFMNDMGALTPAEAHARLWEMYERSNEVEFQGFRVQREIGSVLLPAAVLILAAMLLNNMLYARLSLSVGKSFGGSAWYGTYPDVVSRSLTFLFTVMAPSASCLAVIFELGGGWRTRGLGGVLTLCVIAVSVASFRELLIIQRLLASEDLDVVVNRS